ncbi:MAG: hypothetical protein IKV43_04475 [Clostridia bacterium]|nr:hypothetical protein [Clostridia bacterium]
MSEKSIVSTVITVASPRDIVILICWDKNAIIRMMKGVKITFIGKSP